MHNHEPVSWIKPLSQTSTEPAWQQLQTMAEQLELQIDVLESQPTEAAVAASEHKVRFLRWLKIFRAELRPSLKPSLLLPHPIPLDATEVRDLTKLKQRAPSTSWWRRFRKTQEADPGRDYILATNGNGQMVWVSIEKKTGQYFLHGFFD